MSADRPWEDFDNPIAAPKPDAAAAPAADRPWEGYTSPFPSPAQDVGPPVPPLNREFGSLTPYTPSPSERIGNYASDLYRWLGADPYTAGKFGRGTRDIVMMTPAGVPISGADVQHYTNQGDYGNAALSAVGVIPGGQIGKKAIAPVAQTLAPNFADTSLGQVFKPAPSSEQLLSAGSQQIRDFAQGPAVYSPQAARSFVRDTRAALAREGMYPDQNKGAYEALQVLEDKANANGLITRQDIDEYRKSLSLLKKGPQAPAAMQSQTELYGAMAKTGDDTLQRGIENYGAGKRAEMVETILRNSERARNPDLKLAADTRSMVQTLEKRPRGFTDEEVARLDAARKGSLPVRIAEGASDFLKTGNYLPYAGAAASAGLAAFGPLGGAAATLPPAASLALNRIGGASRRAAAEEAGNLIAQRSPLFREAQAYNTANNLTYPGSPAQDFVMRNAIAQELVRRQRGETD